MLVELIVRYWIQRFEKIRKIELQPLFFYRTPYEGISSDGATSISELLTGFEECSSCGYRSRTCSRVKAVSISHESRNSHVAPAIPLINRRSIKYGVRVSDTDAFAHINERKRAWQVMQLIRGHAILSFNIPLGPPQYYCTRCIRTTESVDIHPLLQSVAVTSDRRIDGYSKETEETNAHLGPQGDERVDKSSSSKDLLEFAAISEKMEIVGRFLIRGRRLFRWIFVF